MSALIEISVSHYTQNGSRYLVECEGEVLIKSARDPFSEAARALVEKGVTGRIQSRWKGSSVIALEGLIAVIATKSCSESQSSSPRIGKYAPHFMEHE